MPRIGRLDDFNPSCWTNHTTGHDLQRNSEFGVTSAYLDRLLRSVRVRGRSWSCFEACLPQVPHRTAVAEKFGQDAVRRNLVGHANAYLAVRQPAPGTWLIDRPGQRVSGCSPEFRAPHSRRRHPRVREPHVDRSGHLRRRSARGQPNADARADLTRSDRSSRASRSNL